MVPWVCQSDLWHQQRHFLATQLLLTGYFFLFWCSVMLWTSQSATRTCSPTGTNNHIHHSHSHWNRTFSDVPVLTLNFATSARWSAVTFRHVIRLRLKLKALHLLKHLSSGRMHVYILCKIIYMSYNVLDYFIIAILFILVSFVLTVLMLPLWTFPWLLF